MVWEGPGIQHLKSLDPGQKHAGMTLGWDCSDVIPRICIITKRCVIPAEAGIQRLKIQSHWIPAKSMPG